MALSDEEVERYSRNILLKEIGGTGQSRLLASSLLLVGAGGLGSPAALYLAAVGVGRLVIMDSDRVERSNLQRQILHTTHTIGQDKVVSAVAALGALNPGVAVEGVGERLTAGNVDRWVGRCDLVLDGSDNFDTRYLLNAACVRAKKTLISGAVVGFDGQVTTVKPGFPCYRCLYPTPPPQGHSPTCAQNGVLGPLAGLVGTVMATEAVKELLGIGQGLAGKLLLFNGLDAEYRTIGVPVNPGCPDCG